MNDQLASAIRSVLKLVGGGLVTKGVTDANTLEIVIAGAIALTGVVMSYLHHKDAAPASKP